MKGAFRRNLDFMLGAGAQQLLILGSTGEFVHLERDQRKEILDAAIEHARGVPVVVNISHTNPRIVADLGRHAKGSGAAAVTLLPPWFFPMSDGDVVEFFVRAIEQIDLPLGLYNFHALTGKRLTQEIVRAIASRARVSGLKHSAGEMEEHRALVETGREFNFNVVTGWDTGLPEAMALGVKGCISGLANMVPEILVKLERLLAAGRNEEAREAAEQMRRIGRAVSALEFPHNVAAAIEARGLEPGVPKTRLCPATAVRYADLRENMRRLLDEFGLPPASAPIE